MNVRFSLLLNLILFPFPAGAVYQAAHLGKGFRVKKFLVKDANIYPIEVGFEFCFY